MKVWFIGKAIRMFYHWLKGITPLVKTKISGQILWAEAFVSDLGRFSGQTFDPILCLVFVPKIGPNTGRKYSAQIVPSVVYGPNSGLNIRPQYRPKVFSQNSFCPIEGSNISQNIQHDDGPKVKACKELMVCFTKYKVITNLVMCI